MRSVLVRAAAVVALSSSAASAQSHNIDFAAFAGTPTPDYSAAAGNPGAGTWNQVGDAAATPRALAGLNGSPSGVIMTVTGATNIARASGNLAPGSLGALLGDHMISTFAPINVDFTGLAPGSYDVYTYIAASFTYNQTVTINNDPSTTVPIQMGITLSLVEGRNYTHHTVTVGDAGTLRVSTVGGDPFLSGVQLVQVPAPAGLVALGAMAIGRRRRSLAA